MTFGRRRGADTVVRGEPVRLPGFEPLSVPACQPLLGDPELGPSPSSHRADAPEPPNAAGPSDAQRFADESLDAARVEMRVEVIRSTKRRRTVGAQVVDGGLRITIPSWMSKAEEAHWVENMTARHRRKMSTDRIDLRARSSELARRYDLPRPREIRWAGDMATRWGSCTPATGTIRLSERLARFPTWVLDYVIVHELAHLEVSGHNPAFWRLVHRYPKSERAIGYLIAKSNDADPDDEI